MRSRRLGFDALPGLRRLREADSRELDLRFWDFLQVCSTYESLAAAASLFWPTFVEWDGCVFLEELFHEKEMKRWRAATNEDPKELERAVNHLEIADFLFPNDPAEGIGDEVYEFIAETLAKSWRCALHDAFPDKQFEIESGEDETGGPTVTFSQVRQRASDD